jgi:hypothetical protein
MLKHQFITKSHDLVGLFEGVNKMSSFMRKLEQQSILDPLRYDPYDYLGHGFEFFVEAFLHLNSSDNRIGVYDYSPVKAHEDTGVDGVGINIKKETSVVQIKYKSNTNRVLTTNEDRLSNMITAGMVKHGVVMDMDNRNNFRHFIFTTASNLHYFTDQHMFEGKVKCFGISNFKSMLDNNIIFWDNIREIVKNLKNKK